MNKYLAFLILIIISHSSFSQDIIRKINGEELKVNITEVTPELIKYKDVNMPEGPLFSIYKSEIKQIEFKNCSILNIAEEPEEKNDVLENVVDEVPSDEKYQVGKVTDTRDNKTYETVIIGKQEWLANNLSFKSEGSLVYDNNADNEERLGRLYTMDQAKSACPEGWHLPSDEEWKELEIELGMVSNVNSEGWRGNSPGQGKLLKKGGESNFNAELGGFSWEKVKFEWLDEAGIFWTATSYPKEKDSFWVRQLGKRMSVKRTYMPKDMFFSVRCVKN